MDIIIREIRKEDIPFTAKIQKESWLTTYVNDEVGMTYDVIYEHVKNTDSPESIVKKEKYLENPDAINLLAEIDGKIVGFLSGTNKEDINELNALYLLKEYQSAGIGTKLIQEFFHRLENKNIPCKVCVASYNLQAINFYKKHGFTKESKGEDHFVGKTINLTKVN